MCFRECPERTYDQATRQRGSETSRSIFYSGSARTEEKERVVLSCFNNSVLYPRKLSNRASHLHRCARPPAHTIASVCMCNLNNLYLAWWVWRREDAGRSSATLCANNIAHLRCGVRGWLVPICVYVLCRACRIFNGILLHWVPPLGSCAGFPAPGTLHGSASSGRMHF